jgi:hypothetical protein
MLILISPLYSHNPTDILSKLLAIIYIDLFQQFKPQKVVLFGSIGKFAKQMIR